MSSNNSNGGRAASASGFMALWAVLAIGHTLASPAEAAPFAYVTNPTDGTVSVIDTATNTVVAIVPMGFAPQGVAVTPDGKRVYVANNGQLSNSVSVIDTASNTVVVTISVGTGPYGVAITPDGKHVYVRIYSPTAFR